MGRDEFVRSESTMRAPVFVFVIALIVGAQAGCEWYKNCGACVADSGCGWCSNDPSGVGSGTIASTTASDGKTFGNIKNDGTAGDISAKRADDGNQPQNGVEAGWLVNVRGQYENIASVGTPADHATLTSHFDFEGTGYVASPYFGKTAGGANRNKGVIGVHKTKFTTELKATYTVTPYEKGAYTVSSVQSDTQATMDTTWTETFGSIEFQIGNIPLSGKISYPDTSKQDVYGSWPPNPTKFTTELKDGYTIKCASGSCGGTKVRVKQIYNDQHMYIEPRFQTSFAENAYMIEIGPRGTGLISGTSGNTRLEGSDPCRTSASEPCYENTRFLTELRVNDRIQINTKLEGALQVGVVNSISDDAHLLLSADLSNELGTNSKFKIKTFHASPFTLARKATGGLTSTAGTSTLVTGSNAVTFTKNLMAGYAIIVKVPKVGLRKYVDGTETSGYEKRTILSIDSKKTLTIDAPFSNPITNEDYNYESCPSLTYENFDLRTENGHGVLKSDGTNHVYDNVQYSMIRTYTDLEDNGGGSDRKDRAAMFMRHLKVGYTLTMDGITRTVTKLVDNTLLHVDRAFKENVVHTDFSYRYSVRKTGDHHMHWKPSTSSGDYHKTQGATDAHIFARSMMANDVNSVAIAKQDVYLQYPPVCYNTGRCVPKTSHSLVGVEGHAQTGAKILSSKLPHETAVADFVQVASSDEYFTNCKPVCTVTVSLAAAPTPPATLRTSETHRVKEKVNSTFIKTMAPFTSTLLPHGSSTSYNARVRYVTGTGSVSTMADSVTVTGASKETKTKFNSEFASGWTISIGCGGATCSGMSCASPSDCAISGKTTGGACDTNVCTAETKNITSVSSDTRLTTSQAFTLDYNKVDYTIGMIPALGYVTNSQNSKIIDGDSNTRFLEQLKVGYTITSMTDTRTITAITSNKLMTVDSAFSNPGITSPTSYKFSGKKGTGEVTVDSTLTPNRVEGTSDVTQTQFQNELSLGYLFMIGHDYKVITKINSNTKLEVDTAFSDTATASSLYTSNDYNYESCWLSRGGEAGVISGDSVEDALYTNKKVYVEDACEIKPGCCGFKLSSVVYPDRFAYYKIRPPHTNMNIRVVVKTTEDNVDLVVKKSAVPTTSSYDYKSVRESNPWALTVPQDKITCPAWTGRSQDMTPNNCDYWYIGVRGDNRYPQKTGASEYDLYVYTEFDWPNFLCSDAKPDQADNKCKWLGISKNEDTNMITNDDSQAVMRLTPAINQCKGSMYYSTKLHLYDGFETTFQFRMTGFSVGCNSVLYPSGFCGGGDGFAFVIQKHNDQQIGCTGSGLGYATTTASKQGNDWARHRCTVVNTPGSTCDSDEDGVFTDACAVGTLCTVTGANNGGCGVQGTCAFQSCTQAISMLVAVEFDTWNNLKLHDPKQGVSRWWINATEFVGYNDNHVAIFASNDQMQSDHAMNEHFAATPSIPNLADGKNHTVKIKYWPTLNDPGREHDGTYNRTNWKQRGKAHTTNIVPCGDCQDTYTPNKFPAPDNCHNCRMQNNKPGNFAVFIDDMKRPVLQTAISLRKSSTISADFCYDSDRDRCVLDESGNAYIGFTAATGGERAQGRTAWKGQDTSVANDVSGDFDHKPYVAGASLDPAAVENAGKMLGAAQNHEILNWKFCNQIGCVPI